MGNVQQHDAQVQGRGLVSGRRTWQSLVQWPSSATRSRSSSSSAAPPTAASPPSASLSALTAPMAATPAPDAVAEASSFSPEKDREELRRRWGETTMYRRLAKELQVFMREALDGVVLVLPMEYADTDAAGFLSAAHPPSCQTQQQQQQGSTASSGGDSAPTGSTPYSSSGNKSLNGSSSAAQLLSRFPPAALHYRAGTSEGLKWLVALEGAPDTAYAGEAFLLSFQFFPKYPIDSPELVFVTPFVPLHPHVYSNGHICLSILYDHWSPALGVKACCISLLSMLSSNLEKQAPVDDRLYCQARGLKGPKGVKWLFHDDRV
ncbi:hypothetical protein Emag_005839 [Eimeria magna]